jgi:hypothetical protein
MLDKIIFTKFLRQLKVILPTRAPDTEDPDVVNLWYDAFSGYTSDDMRFLYKTARTACKVFPSISEMLEFLQSTTRPSLADKKLIEPPKEIKCNLCGSTGWINALDSEERSYAFRCGDCSTATKLGLSKSIPVWDETRFTPKGFHRLPA